MSGGSDRRALRPDGVPCRADLLAGRQKGKGELLRDFRVGSFGAIGAKGLRKGNAAHLLAFAALACATPSVAQIVPPGMAPPAPIVPPSTSPSGAPTGVVADPLRVYGDDAPLLGGLNVLAGVGFTVSGGINTEYSDNVARLSDGEPLSARYKSKGDWIFRPSVTVGGGRAFGRQQLFVTSTLGRDFYARNTLLNRNRFLIDGGLNWALGTRCGGRVQGGYSNRGTQLGTFEQVIPSTQIESSFLVAANCRTATGLSANLNYNRSKITNHTDDPEGIVDRSFANVKSHGVNGGIGYPIGQRGEIGIQGNWNEQDFPNQLLFTGEPNGSKSYGVNAFGNYRVGTSLRVTGGLGKSWVNPRAMFAEDFSGVVWNLGVNYSGPRLGASVSTGKSVNGSTGGTANYTIGSFFNGTITYKANPKLSLATGIATSDTDYRGIEQLPETEGIKSAKIRRYFIGADYRLNKIVSLSLDFNHLKRSSEPTSDSYKVNTVGLSVRGSF